MSWVELVDILAYIQAMFHQVVVLGKQRSFLTIYDKIVNYQVCTHLFGIISIPSSNYYESNKAIYKAIYNSNGY